MLIILAQKGCSKKPKTMTRIQFYLILFLGKQSRIFPPSMIKISFIFHTQPVKFSFRVFSRWRQLIIFHALGRFFLFHFFTSGSPFPSPLLFTTSLSLQLVLGYLTDTDYSNLHIYSHINKYIYIYCKEIHKIYFSHLE